VISPSKWSKAAKPLRTARVGWSSLRATNRVDARERIARYAARSSENVPLRCQRLCRADDRREAEKKHCRGHLK
jgi:hypothetical protein